LRENIKDVADENGVQEKKDVCLLAREIFPGKFNVAQGWSMVKRYEMPVCCDGMQGKGQECWSRTDGGYQ
jgi:hypothetical protein